MEATVILEEDSLNVSKGCQTNLLIFEKIFENKQMVSLQSS